MSKKFYITTAIAYTSRKPHIGNTYEIVLTDAIARYRRMLGDDVFFLTGTDEHGQKIENYANEAGISPQQYVDGVAGEIRAIWDLMNTSYDKFIRTTDDYHVKAVQKIFKKLYEQGDIYKSEYEGLYCTPCESFFTETQLVDGKCPDCGREVTKTKEEAYFFKLSKYTDRLIKYIEENPNFIHPPARKNEMINNFLKPGLQDLCVSRTSFKWGVPVTFDDKHVIYVWIDALSNYITALGYTPDEQGELYNKYWPADVHIIGKDILRFHTLYWPIMLMALGQPLPKQVFGHPWLLSGNDKMSKSKGNVIYADDLVSYFGVDAVRYYVLSEMPYAQDGNITYETIIARFNSDLANTLGNLVNRTIAMTNKYFDGVVTKTGVSEAVDSELINEALAASKKIEGLMEEFHVADSLDVVLDLARRCNKYIDETMPWALAKDEAKADRLKEVLYNLTESIRFISVLIAPFLPETSDKILAQLGNPVATYESLCQFGKIESGHRVNAAEIIFSRIDADKKMAEIEADIDAKYGKKEEKPEGLALIGIDDFSKVELIVGEIKACEPIKKSKKLLKLKVFDGYDERQVCSGISEYYKPEELIGKKIILVSNLAPVKLCGEESCGMILAADDKDSVKVIFIDDSISAGSRIR
ncbi:MAG: methionine--tRNA ligase [Oscillospiraceae bacterium]|nr:methionine--tRNA ligase [Oscillospiraceae bacterium]